MAFITGSGNWSLFVPIAVVSVFAASVGAQEASDEPCEAFVRDVARLVAMMEEDASPEGMSQVIALAERLTPGLRVCGNLVPNPDAGLAISRVLPEPRDRAAWAGWAADWTSRADVRAIAALESAEQMLAAGLPLTEQLVRVDQALELAPLLPQQRWESGLPELARGRWIARHGGGRLIITPLGSGSPHSERLSLYAALPDLLAFAANHQAIVHALDQWPSLLSNDGPVMDGVSMLERFAELEGNSRDPEIADRARAARDAALALIQLLIQRAPELAFTPRPVFRLEAGEEESEASGDSETDTAAPPNEVPAPAAPLGRIAAALIAGAITALALFLLHRRKA